MTRHRFRKPKPEYQQPEKPLELFGPFRRSQMDGFGKMEGFTLDWKPHYVGGDRERIKKSVS